MAVKPSECVKLQESEEAELKSLEKYIDKTLMDKFMKGEKVKMIIDRPSERVLDSLFKMYKDNGWAIDISGEFNCSFRNEPPTMELTFREFGSK